MTPIDIIHLVVTAACAAVLGFIAGIGWDYYNQQRLAAQCPPIHGKLPATIQIAPDGAVRCVYIKAYGVVGESRKGWLK